MPNEYYYQSQLATIICLWLPSAWHFFPEVTNNSDQHRNDFVIERPGYGRYVLESEAASSDRELKEHYTRAAEYGNLIGADHVWVVHFCAMEGGTLEQLPVPQTGSNIHVLHLLHTTNNNTISWSAHYCEAGSYQTKAVEISEQK